MIVDACNVDQLDKPTIIELPLDPAVEDLRHGHQLYQVHMEKDGSVISCENFEIDSYNIGGNIHIIRRSQYPHLPDKNMSAEYLIALIWAKDETHAIKITNEHRTHKIANGEW